MEFRFKTSGHLQTLGQFLQDRLHRDDLYFGFNDAQLTAVIPVAAYWLYATFYEVLDYFDFFPEYRQLPSEEERSRNVPTRTHVLKHVLFLHVSQLLMGFAVDYFGVGDVGAQTTAWWGDIIWSYYPKQSTGLWDLSTLLSKMTTLAVYGSYLIARQFLALAVIDTWVFWLHYGMHKIPWLYRKRLCRGFTLPYERTNVSIFKETYTLFTMNYTHPTLTAPCITASLKGFLSTSWAVSSHKASSV